MTADHYDWIIIGSGFGGSVSALRLAEKGYRVLVVEKGRRFEADDFPKTNWDVRNWLWQPQIGLRGIMQMSFMDHVTVLHGVGVGGGSLTYANTLPLPKDEFFTARSWGHLADWRKELEPHYATARRMLGSARNPLETRGDRVLREIARDLGREDQFHFTDVGVHFGDSGQRVPDPYFGGKGPARVGCTFCGACMTGCRVGAKNTLDRNYLYLAERLGAEVLADTEVRAVRPLNDRAPANADRGNGLRGQGGLGPTTGYRLECVSRGGSRSLSADRVIFAGGVMGTIPLLLRMQEDRDGLPALSSQLGRGVRTNNEALIGVISPRSTEDFSKGIAITSILHTDEHSHIEPVRYSPGSGFFRLLTAPHSPGSSLLTRVGGTVRGLLREPGRWARALTVRDFARQSQILLYMRTLEGTLTLKLGRSPMTGFTRGLVTSLDPGTPAPKAFMEEATDLANRFAEKVDGVAMTLVSETLLGTPSTAHILGGACMGRGADDGVIDAQHRVFGYDGLYVIDGAAVSANPGVNPSLTITALAERAMSGIPAKAA